MELLYGHNVATNESSQSMEGSETKSDSNSE